MTKSLEQRISKQIPVGILQARQRPSGDLADTNATKFLLAQIGLARHVANPLRSLSTTMTSLQTLPLHFVAT